LIIAHAHTHQPHPACPTPAGLFESYTLLAPAIYTCKLEYIYIPYIASSVYIYIPYAKHAAPQSDNGIYDLILRALMPKPGV